MWIYLITILKSKFFPYLSGAIKVEDKLNIQPDLDLDKERQVIDHFGPFASLHPIGRFAAIKPG